MTSRPRWTAAALAVAAASLAACTAAPRPARTGPLRVGLFAAPLSLDPHLEAEFLTAAVLANVFEGLTSLDGAMRVQPMLAVSWDTPDPLTWRFRLRHGVRFHDGRPVGARDVAWSLERARRHPHSSVAHYLADVAELRVAAPDVIEIRTEASTSLLLNRLAFVAIVPEGSPAQIRSPIGTGPYGLATEGFPEVLTLRRSDLYWGPRPTEPVVQMLVVKEAVRLREMLLSGALDVSLSPTPEEAERMRAEPCCRVVARPSVVIEVLQCRVDRPPFDDLRVRRAVNLALDRPLHVARVLRGWGEPASQLASPGTVGFAPSIRTPERDLVEARRLLAAAGHPHGLSATLDFREDRRADEIRRQLGEAGIELTLRPSPWAEVLGRVRSGEAQLYYGAFTADTGDAGDILDSAVHTPQPGAGLGVANHFGYSSPEVDGLLLAARTAPTLLDRRRALQRAMERVMADLPMVPVAVPYDLYVVRHDVRWTPRLDGRVLAAELAREPEQP